MHQRSADSLLSLCVAWNVPFMFQTLGTLLDLCQTGGNLSYALLLSPLFLLILKFIPAVCCSELEPMIGAWCFVFGLYVRTSLGTPPITTPRSSRFVVHSSPSSSSS